MKESQPQSVGTDDAVLKEAFSTSVVPGSARYWAAHFSHQHVRPRIQAIFCFAHLMDQLAVASPEVIREKSLWWHEELQRFSAQEPRHPILQVLHRLAHAGLDPASLAAALHEQLHGALSTQQKIAISSDEEWRQYTQLRLGSLHTLLGLVAEMPTDDAAVYGTWAGNFEMQPVLRAPQFFADNRWTIPTHATGAARTDATSAEQLHTAERSRPGHGARASEVLLANDLHWWRRTASAASPFYSNTPLGIGGMFRSWRAARTTPYF